MWSRHSRRIEPVSLSTYAFCHGDRGAIGRSRMPMAHRRCTKDQPVRGVPIPDEVSRRMVPWESLGNRARDPLRGRICRYAKRHPNSSSMPHDDKTIEDRKAEPGHLAAKNRPSLFVSITPRVRKGWLIGSGFESQRPCQSCGGRNQCSCGWRRYSRTVRH